MKSFDPEISFKKNWRSYQKRVLSELETHLNDNHLHIVAAPGSGKTVLGLEVVRKLGKPAIIFSPTLTIRDQWAERFSSLFCPDGYDVRPLISKDLREPKLLTLSSYQGLHSVYTGDDPTPQDAEEEPDEATRSAQTPANTGKKAMIRRLKEFGIGTIVIDEAHHLRNEWWKCLIDLKKQLHNPTIVALTATPPVDVNPWEWQRYQDMCGPIDSEIAAPELIKEKNLCPHQDYVYFSTPTKHEKQTIQTFRAGVREVFERICHDTRFLEIIKAHPYVNDPERYLNEILEDPAFFSSIMVFVWHVQRQYSRKLIKVLGGSRKRIPKLNYEWMEILLTGCLYRHADTFPDENVLPDEIVSSLKRIGAVEKRLVQLRSTTAIKKLLASSVSKLHSIEDVVALESQALQNNLRMVILTDYIRKADLPRNADDLKPLKRIGVIPIFELLRRSDIDVKLGILCGSLVVIPQYAVEQLQQMMQDHSIDSDRIRINPLSCDDQYVVVSGNGSVQAEIVKAVTRLFNQGGIEVLIGTKSLLGEGWDAPAINSLILASFVGSFMLSNQMRGRAIRIQDGNPEKTSNIWHLVCIEEGSGQESDDFAMLTRRFKSYVGISFTELAIQNGLKRLGIDDPPFSRNTLKKMNRQMVAYALDRDGMRQRWRDAFAANETAQMIEEVQSPTELMPKNLIFAKTIKALLWDVLFWTLYVLSQFQFRAQSSESANVPLLFIRVVLGLAALAGLPFCLKALYLFLKHGPIALCMQKIGRALLESLVYTGDIQTKINKMGVKVEHLEAGYVSCSLSGATTYEKSLFLDALQEILEPIQNPRYVLVRMSFFFGWLSHAVPALLGKRKETAEYFAARWKKHLGASHLIYTRSVEGRQALIKARGASMFSQFQKRSERVNAWK